MPQMIPAKLFSMVTLGPELSLTLSSTADNWLTPYNGRKGSIFSSSLWTPEATSGYNHTFGTFIPVLNTSQLLKFQYQLMS